MILYLALFLQTLLILIILTYLFVEVEKIKNKQEKDNTHLLNNIKNLTNLINENKINIL